MATPEQMTHGIDRAPDSTEAAKRLAPERAKLATEVTTDATKKSADHLSEEMKAKDKAEFLAILEKDNVDFKTVEDIEKATERYGAIMDKWGMDVVLGWIP
jgi:DNA transposition AAA+ family ATPase